MSKHLNGVEGYDVVCLKCNKQFKGRKDRKFCTMSCSTSFRMKDKEQYIPSFKNMKHNSESRDGISKAVASSWVNDIERKRKTASTLSIVCSRKPKFTDTKPERDMHTILDRFGIKYSKNVPIKLSNGKIHRADILLQKSNTVIEIDGRYWHTRPGARERDEFQTSELQRMGYGVIRIWDDELTDIPLIEFGPQEARDC